jgi:hypothetical protein
MLAANGVDRVKLFDADPWTVSALAGSGVQAMLAVPNDHLASVARDPRRARDWVRDNVTRNIEAGVDVRYVTHRPPFPLDPVPYLTYALAAVRSLGCLGGGVAHRRMHACSL